MIVGVVASVVCPLVLGWGVVAVALRSDRLGALERIGCAFAFGTFFLAMILAAWIASGLPPVRALAIAAPIGAGAALAVVGRMWPAPVHVEGRRGGGSRAERAAFAVVLALILALVVDRAALWNLEPVFGGDESLIFAARAKLLYAGWISPAPLLGFAPDAPLLHHADYPLLNPLIQIFTHVASGQLVDFFQRVPMQAFVIAVVVVAAARCRTVVRPAAAALLVLLWLPGPFLARSSFPAISDMLVAGGFLLAIEAWRDFAAGMEAASWRRFAWAAALLVSAKHEGTMLLVCLVLAAGLNLLRDGELRRGVARLRWNAAWLLLPAMVLAATWTVNALAGRGNDLITDNPGGLAVWQRVIPQFQERAFRVASFVWSDVVADPAGTRLSWLPFLAVLVLAPRWALSPPHAAATLAILGGAAGYVLVFIGTYHDLEWHWSTAGPRVFFHLWPALFVWNAHAVAHLFPRLTEPVHAPILT